MTTRFAYTVLVVAAACGVLACEDEIVTNTAPPPGVEAAPKKEKPASAASAQAIVEFSDSDFVESEANRDPFRSFENLFIRRTARSKKVQRKVKAGSYALEELKLMGLVTRSMRSALLTDPSGFGWVVYTGDYVGTPELVSLGGTEGLEIPVNWRVDRIRSKDVVFIREDTAHPEIAPTTRVMPLYPVGEDEAEKITG